MPGIEAPGDMVVTTKKRYELLGTDLELTLRSHEIDSLLLLGVQLVRDRDGDRGLGARLLGVPRRGGRRLDARLGFHDAARLVIGASFGWMVDAGDALEGLRALRHGAAA